jgi:hypothetical protein
MFAPNLCAQREMFGAYEKMFAPNLCARREMFAAYEKMFAFAEKCSRPKKWSQKRKNQKSKNLRENNCSTTTSRGTNKRVKINKWKKSKLEIGDRIFSGHNQKMRWNFNCQFEIGLFNFAI